MVDVVVDEQVKARFWDKVRKGSGNECWEWRGAKSRGYGSFWDGERVVRAHRMAWVLSGQQCPDGLVLDHLCRNRACVNPGHLEPVSVAENNRRGDGFSGENVRKTHCPKGHPLSGDNLLADRPDGRADRRCKTCQREYAKRRRAELLAEKVATGEAAPLLNSQKKACPKGHALLGDNLYIDPKGWRSCRKCKQERTKASKERRKANASR